jgi:hypothetical protein
MTPEKADAIIIDYDIVRKREPDILADYRQWRSMQEDRIGTHSPECHLWPRHERCMIYRLAAALEKERQVLSQANLTAEERAAVEYFSKWGTWTSAAPHAAALLALLERTK